MPQDGFYYSDFRCRSADFISLGIFSPNTIRHFYSRKWKVDFLPSLTMMSIKFTCKFEDFFQIFALAPGRAITFEQVRMSVFIHSMLSFSWRESYVLRKLKGDNSDTFMK